MKERKTESKTEKVIGAVIWGAMCFLIGWMIADALFKMYG